MFLYISTFLMHSINICYNLVNKPQSGIMFCKSTDLLHKFPIFDHSNHKTCFFKNSMYGKTKWSDKPSFYYPKIVNYFHVIVMPAGHSIIIQYQILNIHRNIKSYNVNLKSSCQTQHQLAISNDRLRLFKTVKFSSLETETGQDKYKYVRSYIWYCSPQAQA